jgi:hypothetical protein
MTDNDHQADIAAIEAIVARQFASLNWQDNRGGDWSAFSEDFAEDASLYPAARPVRRQTVAGFVERMHGLAKSTMRSFAERPLGSRILVYGNIAVALAGCEMTENDGRPARGVEALLLVKSGDRWEIVAQTWHMADDEHPFPDDLLSG